MLQAISYVFHPQFIQKIKSAQVDIEEIVRPFEEIPNATNVLFLNNICIRRWWEKRYWGHWQQNRMTGLSFSTPRAPYPWHTSICANSWRQRRGLQVTLHYIYITASMYVCKVFWKHFVCCCLEDGHLFEKKRKFCGFLRSNLPLQYI